MGRKAELSVETRAVIAALHGEGYSTRKIASKCNVSQNAVMRTLQRKSDTGCNQSRHRSGRPKTTSKGEDTFICVVSKKNRFLTAPEIREQLNSSREAPVSVSTVQRRLRNYGLKGCVAAKKPLLRKQNKVKRLNWAKKHKEWTTEQWSKVLFTDESKFEIFNKRRRQYVRRFVGERMMNQCVVPTVKHGGGSVLVWGCFAGDKVGDIVQIEGIIDKKSLPQHTSTARFSVWEKTCGQRIRFPAG